MKSLRRNKTKFWYCLFESKTPIYDEYDNETPESEIHYSDPVDVMANISPATGQSNVEQFGNLEDYDKVIVTTEDLPIDENSVLFIDKDPEFGDDGEPLFDYKVRRVAKSLNSLSIAVSKVKVS